MQLTPMTPVKGSADSGLTAAQALAVLDRIPAVVTLWDAELTCQFANQAAVVWFGKRRLDEVVGEHAEKLLGGPAFAANLPYVRLVLEGIPQDFERAVLDTSGVLRHTRASMTPVLDDGSVTGFQVLVADISDRVVAEGERLSAVEREARVAMAEHIGSKQHEVLTQRLFAATLQLSSLISSEGGDQTGRLAAAIDDIDSAIHELRVTLFEEPPDAGALPGEEPVQLGGTC